MAAAAAAAHAGIDDRVYRAVIVDKPPEEVKEIIEEVAQGDDVRRAAAVNRCGINAESGEQESPLLAAMRLEHDELVGPLVVAGADVKTVYNGETTAIGLCCWYGGVAAVRALLKKGHDPNERMRYFGRPGGDARADGVTAAHICTVTRFEDSHAPQLECLLVLVQEYGADINARDADGRTPLHWLAKRANHPAPRSAVDLFVSLGADLEARDMYGQTPIFDCAEQGDLQMLSALRGASVDVINEYGMTPLIFAAWLNKSATRRDVVEELVRRSSLSTRHAVDEDGDSAIDLLVIAQRTDDTVIAFQPWHLRVAAELLRSGGPAKSNNALRLLPAAAAHSIRLAAELAERRSESRRWRAYDCIVPMAFDALELREVEEGVRRREARVRELEAAVLDRMDELQEEVAALEEDALEEVAALAEEVTALEEKVAALEEKVARARRREHGGAA